MGKPVDEGVVFLVGLREVYDVLYALAYPKKNLDFLLWLICGFDFWLQTETEYNVMWGQKA